MLEIIDNIPTFVWPLFFILLLGGLKAKKTAAVPLVVLLIIPAAFFIWSLFSFFCNHGSDLLPALFWILSLSLGFYIGYSHMQSVELCFNKQKKQVEIPGSWIPLILSMSIFASKFSAGMMEAMHPNALILILALELFSTVILGIFVGRGINCFLRYRAASNAIAQ
jgi:hypothetical protein